ncbi:H/ACA ribonucleoprotein complex non-core subunit NAF1-like [Adelges cooleyi]|uniref:H/ACA ribonucleoprotein complex non-core subunit NAF1-like n=1 Tax=Adelges cooleyi TaxID=133065 RepID=UPI002180143F|nr:H/ACA ribonucleoprotein complex non-core subunit NAF1-like [Adelges cooleyi]
MDQPEPIIAIKNTDQSPPVDDCDGGDVGEPDPLDIILTEVRMKPRETIISDSSSSEETSDNEGSVISIASSKDTYSGIPKTKGELSLTDLPPIEDLCISVEEEQCKPIGSIKSIVDSLVVVEAFINVPPLDIDSVLFVDRGKRALGKIFEVVGPVNKPYYTVRFNGSDHVQKFNVNVKETVYCAPQTDYTSYVFISKVMQHKGSDASWKDNNEPPPEYVEYSDDEQEKLAKKNRKRNKKTVPERHVQQQQQQQPPQPQQQQEIPQTLVRQQQPQSPQVYRPQGNAQYQQPVPPVYHHQQQQQQPYPQFQQQQKYPACQPPQQYAQSYQQPQQYPPYLQPQQIYPTYQQPPQQYPLQQHCPPPFLRRKYSRPNNIHSHKKLFSNIIDGISKS